LGAALLASSLGVVAEAHLAKTDAVLLALCVAAQGALGEIYARHRRAGVRAWAGWAVLFWGAQGAAVLIKGPVAPLLSLLTIAALGIADRDLRWLGGLRAWWGAPLCVAVVAPWLIAISLATHGQFLGQSLGHDFLGKLVGAQEAHGAPPLYYVLLLAITFWPGSLFLGPMVRVAWRERRETATRFLIAWAVPFWLVLELVPTKLPHYILPAYPALALLAGRALAAFGTERHGAWLDRLVAIVWAITSVALAAVLIVAPLRFGRGVDAAGAVAGAIILLLGGRMVLAAWRGMTAGLAGRAMLLALFVLAPAFGIAAPTLDRLWLSRSAAALVAAHPAAPGAPLAAVGYAEPSLVFLLGTKTQLLSPAAAAQAIAATPGGEALVESREDAAFRRALTGQGRTPRALGQIAGLDYSNGRQMVLTLYAANTGPAP
jgi:4-amino-4-deoxy-L-arabinose transferase-like glycosyltransferase